MGETATRILLGFVIAGAVLLTVGLIVLIWLLASGVQGGRTDSVSVPPVLSLSEGERIVTIARGPDDIVLLVQQPDGRQLLRRIDPDRGDVLGELPVVTAP